MAAQGGSGPVYRGLYTGAWILALIFLRSGEEGIAAFAVFLIPSLVLGGFALLTAYPLFSGLALLLSLPLALLLPAGYGAGLILLHLLLMGGCLPAAPGPAAGQAVQRRQRF